MKFSELNDKAQESLQECGKRSLVNSVQSMGKLAGVWLVNSVTKLMKACKSVVSEVQ